MIEELTVFGVWNVVDDVLHPLQALFPVTVLSGGQLGAGDAVCHMLFLGALVEVHQAAELSWVYSESAVDVDSQELKAGDMFHLCGWVCVFRL